MSDVTPSDPASKDERPSRGLRGAGIFLGVALAAACASCALFLGPSSEEKEMIREVVRQDETLLVDVRSPGEFAEGHLKGAVNIPVGEIEGRLEELGAKDRPLVLY